jgi:hypothetical protein
MLTCLLGSKMLITCRLRFFDAFDAFDVDRVMSDQERRNIPSCFPGKSEYAIPKKKPRKVRGLGFGILC